MHKAWVASSIPGSGRSPGGGHGNPLQYSCLENLMDRGAWQATVHGVARSQTWLKQLNTAYRCPQQNSGSLTWFLLFLPPYKASWYFRMDICLLGGLDGKESACSAGDLGLIPGSERSPGEGNSNPLQYSCQNNPVNKGAWWVTVHRVVKSQTWLKQLSTQALPSKLCLNIQMPDQGITCYFHSKFPWQINEFIYLLKSFWWCQEMF